MRSLCKVLWLITLCFPVILLMSCGGGSHNLTGETSPPVEPLACVVLVPAEILYDKATQDPAQKEDLQKGADYLQQTLVTQLQQSQVEKIIEVDQLRQQVDEVSGGMLGVIKKIGENAQCNAVLLATISQFSQRQGGSYAVDSPAAAAFDLRLVDAVSGDSLWNASFNETQASLLSNLFTFDKVVRRGFKWITVEELVKRGVQEKLEECPYFYRAD